MALAGRSGAIAELAVVLERAIAGSGGLVGVVGPPGSGKTALLAVAATTARARGLDVVGVAPVRGRPGRSVWAESGHFPHLAHLDRFVDRLAATGPQWTESFEPAGGRRVGFYATSAEVPPVRSSSSA